MQGPRGESNEEKNSLIEYLMSLRIFHRVTDIAEMMHFDNVSVLSRE
jgi:hypothetical protein